MSGASDPHGQAQDDDIRQTRVFGRYGVAHVRHAEGENRRARPAEAMPRVSGATPDEGDMTRARQVSMIESIALAALQPTADELRARSEAAEIVARPDLLLSSSGALPDHPWSSIVHWARWTEEEVETRISEVLDFFRSRRQAFVWLVTDRSTPASLGERLASHGFIREMDCRMLVAVLPVVGLRVNPEVRVLMVADRDGVRDGMRVDHPDWDDVRAAAEVDDRMRRLGTSLHVAVAYLGGRPVGTARWSIDRPLQVVELNGAVTLADYRGRGIYSTLVAFRSAHAAREGCTVAAIIADRATSVPILLKRGFRDIGPATYYLWPSISLPSAP